MDSHKSIINNKDRIKVETRTLNSMLKAADAPFQIDYLSLDTEGSELEVLQGVDLEKYRFGFITVEHNWVEPKRTQIKQLLESNGYLYLRENKFDDYYTLS